MVSSRGFGLSLLVWMLCAFRRPTVCQLLSVLSGFGLPVSSSLFLLVLLIHATLSLLNSWSGSSGRFLQREFSLSGKTFHVCSIYCPNRNPSWGVRQGFSLSPLLYVLISEVLAANIRCNPRISGLCLPGSAPLYPISQYADDTSLILQSDDSIKASFEVDSLFEKASGSKLHQSKSKGLWLGGWSGCTDPPVALVWSSVKIKAVGMFVGVGDLEVDNWRPLITAVDNVLKSWPARSLSFKGKSFVINALALSRIWYVASLIHMPPWVLRELSIPVFSFF